MDDGFQLRIDRSETIMVNTYDKDEKSVWLSIYIHRANTSIVLSREQARELIAALEQVVA